MLTAPLATHPGPSAAPDDFGLLAPGRLLYAEGGDRLAALAWSWIARTAALHDVLYLDGGNSLDVPRLAEAARRLRLPVEDVLRGVRVARGFTAHQWAALLDAAPALTAQLPRPGLVVAAGFPDLYLDEDVGGTEGRVLARRGAGQLAALARAFRLPVLVTSRGATGWMRDLLHATADETLLLTPAGRGAQAALLKAGRTVLLAPDGRQRLLSEFASSVRGVEGGGEKWNPESQNDPEARNEADEYVPIRHRVSGQLRVSGFPSVATPSVVTAQEVA